jgi:hypothetical protein
MTGTLRGVAATDDGVSLSTEKTVTGTLSGIALTSTLVGTLVGAPASCGILMDDSTVDTTDSISKGSSRRAPAGPRCALGGFLLQRRVEYGAGARFTCGGAINANG